MGEGGCDLRCKMEKRRFLCPVGTEPYIVKTGEWRAERPVTDPKKCVRCATCWLYCPTQSIRDFRTHLGADLQYCKGCGICAEECPRHAIIMVLEEE